MRVETDEALVVEGWLGLEIGIWLAIRGLFRPEGSGSKIRKIVSGLRRSAASRAPGIMWRGLDDWDEWPQFVLKCGNILACLKSYGR